MTQWGLFGKTLRDARVMTLTMALVIVVMAYVDVRIYPSYRDTFKDLELPEIYQGFFGEAGSMTSAVGFISAEFFSWIPLLLITIAIIGGTGAIAGEEAAGTLDLLLAQPISRARLLLIKTAALTLAISLTALVSMLGFLAAMASVSMDLSKLNLWSAVVSMVPLTLFFLGLSLFGSAALPSRGAAALLVIGAVIIGYFVNTLGASVPLLATPRKFTPFYWADGGHVLIHGFDWLRAGGLLGCALLFVALAVWRFERRDISVGATEWQWRPWRRHGPPPPAVRTLPDTLRAADVQR